MTSVPLTTVRLSGRSVLMLFVGLTVFLVVAIVAWRAANWGIDKGTQTFAKIREKATGATTANTTESSAPPIMAFA